MAGTWKHATSQAVCDCVRCQGPEGRTENAELLDERITLSVLHSSLYNLLLYVLQVLYDED